MGPKKDAAPAIPVRRDALKGQSVIITGEIEGYSRKAAEQILINAGATIEKSLNKKVQLVVLGEKAGPKKLEKIEELGLEQQDWDELIEEIKTEDGEEPTGDGGDDEDEDIEDEEEEEEVEEKPKPQKGKGKAKANTKAKADPAPKPKPSVSSGDIDLEGKKVLVTGTIPGHDRKSVQAVLENAGAEVEKSLNKKVELAILGANPGPDKLKKMADMGIETVQWNDLAEQLGLEVPPEKKAADVGTGAAPDSIDGMTLIITGAIDGHTRASAEKVLETAGATFAKSLNKSVELVVLGAKPGPDKLNKIADLNIPTCSFDALVEKLGLEAEASEPPKKKSRKN